MEKFQIGRITNKSLLNNDKNDYFYIVNLMIIKLESELELLKCFGLEGE